MNRFFSSAVLAALVATGSISCRSAQLVGHASPLIAEIRLDDTNLRRGDMNRCMFLVRNASATARELCLEDTPTAYLNYPDGTVHRPLMGHSARLHGCDQVVTLVPGATKQFPCQFFLLKHEPLGDAQLRLSVWLRPEGELSAQVPVCVRRGPGEEAP